MTSSQQLFDLLAKLVAARPLTATSVSHVTGAPLARDPIESIEYFSVYHPREWINPLIASLELREPTAASEARDGLLELELNRDVRISREDVTNAYGDDFTAWPPNPESPADEPVYFSYSKPWGELSFGFARTGDERLIAVVLDASGEPASSQDEEVPDVDAK